MKTIKGFNDLKFKKHPNGYGKQATMKFDNGYGVSIVFGCLYYSNGIDTYEMAVLYNGDLCYDSGITDDVLGHITKEEVSSFMKDVQNLPPKNR